MAITDETIEYVAALAKLDLTDEEKERAKKDLGNIIGYVDTMNQLDTTGIEPMSHVFAYHNVFREDRKSTRLNSSHRSLSRMPSSA